VDDTISGSNVSLNDIRASDSDTRSRDNCPGYITANEGDISGLKISAEDLSGYYVAEENSLQFFRVRNETIESSSRQGTEGSVGWCEQSERSS